MRVSIRFITPLAIVLALFAFGVTPLVDLLTTRWFTRDLDLRAGLISLTLQDALVPLLDVRSRDSNEKMLSLFNRAIEDERLDDMGFCDPGQRLIVRTKGFPAPLGCDHDLPNRPAGVTSLVLDGHQYVVYEPVLSAGKSYGELVLVQNMGFIERRNLFAKRCLVVTFIVLALVVSGITGLIAELSWRRWVSGIRSLLRGEKMSRLLPGLLAPELRPIARDLRGLIRDLESDRMARDESRISWSPQALKEILHNELSGDEVLIVSNREPYIHSRKRGAIEVQIPASGLITALEPIMRACSGTWIAHGSGSADRETVDANDHVRVPPDDPAYRIRRIWLSREEEAGYYYGFANEGLWPLCHIAHTRPVFRTGDWNQYKAVNRKFAEAVVRESKTDDPVILVQDYHFALLPRMIRDRLPRATVITFWHIPWPNSEVFGICPWREELLDGLLGSTIVGYHTRLHCNNFVDSADRYLESRIDREASTISYRGSLTAVNHYPISIEYPLRAAAMGIPIHDCRNEIRRINEMPANHHVAVGVDRLDYTKGILERLAAVERFFEFHPEWIGKFSFIQIAAPSRSLIPQYRSFETEVKAMAARINTRFGASGYEPIRLLVEHHGHEEVIQYFRGADICFVGSLHDGMNLVAKEFVAARDDEQGVLILSQFTGAARELPEALIVNPYNTDQCASAIHLALQMDESEKRKRMRSMRSLIQEFNVYRWAGRMLIDASRIRRRRQVLGNVETPKFPRGVVLST